MTAVRTLVVWCPDWPVLAATKAAGLAADVPAAVLANNRVIACSALARAEGIRRGDRKRSAQGRCPELAVFEEDLARDARVFEPVAAAVEKLATGIEVVRPGIVALPVRGPARYYGSEEAVAERLIDQVAAECDLECQIGVADGLFAATLAARRAMLVPAGGSAAFLAPLSTLELSPPGGPDRSDFVDLLKRLGLRTLGAYASLSERDVASRFGADAVATHRLARGLEERPPARRRTPPELSVTHSPDPPLDRVDAAAFAARALAELLHEKLAARGLACTRLGVHASTGNGEELGRVWRCAEPLTPTGIADRVRWQLDGWLRAAPSTRPSAGITKLWLDPVEVVDATALQLGLWHGGREDPGTGAERASRALVRVQGLLGPDGVVTGVLGGGRGPSDRVRLVPWGEERLPGADPDAPWPGRLPAPSPATVPAAPVAAEVFDALAAPVGVSARQRLTGRPSAVSVAGGPARPVVAWAGPWAAEEAWWEPAGGRRRARLQVLPDGVEQTALLLVREGQGWAVEGVYD